jgi:2'-5' RNA ligase
MAAGNRARVFFAIWPDAGVRDALGAAALRAEAECGGRATPPAKIHLTLFFVGEVDRLRIDALEACAGLVAGTAFILEPSVLGYWRHNRIVWAGSPVSPPSLSRLVADLTSALATAGYRGEERPYVPHVTLVRNARRRPRSHVLDAPGWHAREFALVESAGGRYEPLARWRLEAPL